jgi:transcriptional regulator with XRE-family HTH domain
VIYLGKTIRALREAYGHTQLEAAKLLDVTNVYLSNVEHNRASPSPAFVQRVGELYEVDLYVLAWCLNGDDDTMPSAVQDAARRLTKAMLAQLEAKGISIGGLHDRDKEPTKPRLSTRLATS